MLTAVLFAPVRGSTRVTRRPLFSVTQRCASGPQMISYGSPRPVATTRRVKPPGGARGPDLVVDADVGTEAGTDVATDVDTDVRAKDPAVAAGAEATDPARARADRAASAAVARFMRLRLSREATASRVPSCDDDTHCREAWCWTSCRPAGARQG